jgi:hypothetical protein
MAIIEEKNAAQERAKEIRELRGLLYADMMNLPAGYSFNLDEEQIIRRGFLGFKYIVAHFWLSSHDEIFVRFDENKEYQKLKTFFKNSKTKFRLILDEDDIY